MEPIALLLLMTFVSGFAMLATGNYLRSKGMKIEGGLLIILGVADLAALGFYLIL